MSKNLAVAAFLLSALVVLGQQSTPAPTGPSRVISGPNGNKIHQFLSRSAEKRLRGESALGADGLACSANPPGCTTTPMVYGTGPVMRNPTNYLIFWQPTGGYAPAFPAGYQAGIEKFFQTVGGTPFYNIVTQYNDSTGAPVPNATSLGGPSWTDTKTGAPSGCDGTPTGAVGATPHCPLTDGDIQNEVTVALAANPQWLKPGINVEYYVYTPTSVGECSGKGADGNYQCFAINEGIASSGQDAAFCAYHSYFNTNTIYSFMPFASDGNCIGSVSAFPNSKVLDGVLSPTSHEMLESNTDPLLNGWKGTGANSDEIGDKCSYIYGYVAPNGANFVLNGNQYQIQEEYSNDISACTKRYGPDPVVQVPGILAFGEVQAGTSSQLSTTIQNNGGGDLNILNIRLGAESDGNSYYSLVNAQPTAATLPSGENVTANISFAPSSGATFGGPNDTVIVDTDQTPCGLNQTCTAPSVAAFATVTGTIGVQPAALCGAQVVGTDQNFCTSATASINTGSYDPDGEGVTATQSPAGPYTLGTTNVTLTVVDNNVDHATATCSSTITVHDNQIPSISCPAPKTISCTGPAGAAASFTPTTFDNCPAVTSSCSPTSGSTFNFGPTPVTCTALDSSGNHASCTTAITVTDVPPVISSVVAAPNLLNPPNKKMVPVTILVKDTDVCDASPVCTINSVTQTPGNISSSDFMITGPLTLNLRANGNNGLPKTYIVGVTCSDHHGGSTSAQTAVSAP